MIVYFIALLSDDSCHLIYFFLQFAVLAVDPNNHLLVACIDEFILSVMSVNKFYFVMI